MTSSASSETSSPAAVSDGPEPLVSGRAVQKVFGKRAAEALPLIEQGFDKETIFERTGQTVGVRDAAFDVFPGEVFVIMGLSGSGKSTLLRLVNRLIEPTAGTITVGGQDVTAMSRRELIRLRRTDLTMVFQSFALMDHLRVWENAAFGLDVAGVSHHERRERAISALEQVGLQANADSYPRELSGGMRQRVGLARALASSPKILLMDEAFSALDPLIRTEMQEELLNLQRERDLTVIFISHDLDEAMRIGDRIAIMNDGTIVQSGTPEEILQDPANDYVRSFFGGVDISNVYTAGDLAQPDRATLQPRRRSLRSLVVQLRRADRTYGYVIDESSRFQGMVSIDSLLEAMRAHAREVEQAFLDEPSLHADTSFDEVIHRLAPSPYPLPVVDSEGRYLGTITKSALLETLETRSPP